MFSVLVQPLLSVTVRLYTPPLPKAPDVLYGAVPPVMLNDTGVGSPAQKDAPLEDVTVIGAGCAIDAMDVD